MVPLLFFKILIISSLETQSLTRNAQSLSESFSQKCDLLSSKLILSKN